MLKTRKGLTVEVGNTDAEGRLILCDALAEASRETPDLLIDFATLTGAARVALGTGLPALFCNDEALADSLLERRPRPARPAVAAARSTGPTGPPSTARSPTSTTSPTGPIGGAITAALFLEAFVGDGIPWAHFDLMAWNLSGGPGRPQGGEAMGLRAVYGTIERLAKKGGREQMMAKAVHIETELAGLPVLRGRRPDTHGGGGRSRPSRPWRRSARAASSPARFQGDSAWERHSKGDELVHVLEGRVPGSPCMTDAGPQVLELSAGMLTVVPQGTWHRFPRPGWRNGAHRNAATDRPLDGRGPAERGVAQGCHGGRERSSPQSHRDTETQRTNRLLVFRETKPLLYS